jgi:hypothetical protein
MALPAISAVVTTIAMIPFAVGAFFTSVADTGSSSSSAGSATSLAGYAILFAGYLVAAYVTIFFQAALILAANERLAGGDPTLGSAIAAAGARAGHILPWAIISATVSMILRAIQERSGLLGRIVVGLVGIAWTLVTFLVLPILVIEGTGVRDALSRSATTFKQTWGENVIGNAGIGIAGFLAALAGLAVGLPILFIGIATDLLALVVLAVVALVIWMILVSVFSAAMSGVYQTALYRYAVLGESPHGFSPEQIASAFVPRRGRF